MSEEFYKELPILRPLDEFYEIRGTQMPHFESVDPELLPEPYQFLLYHHSNMTSRLQGFFHESISIRVLQKRQFEEILARQVALVLDQSDEPVEYGAIKINLTLFSPEPRREVQACKRPFGAILNDYEIEYHNRPKAFFKIVADDIMKVALNLSSSIWLYGRCNVLVDDETSLPLAEVVEILPVIEPVS
jgi:chorismate-pyruvate lyase